MKKISLILIVLVVCLGVVSKVISVEPLNVVPNSLELTIASGRLDTAQVVVVNSSDSSISVKSDFDSQWMLIFPSKFKIPPRKARRVLAIFFIPRGENPQREGKFVFRTKDREKVARVKVAISAPRIAIPIVKEEKIEATKLVKEPIITKLEEEVAAKEEKIRKLEQVIEKMKSDHASIVVALRSEINSLQQEIQKKRELQVVVRPVEKPKPVKEPKPVEELKPLYSSLVENLVVEAEKDEIRLVYQGDKVSLVIPGQISFASGKVCLREKGLKVLRKLGRLLKEKAFDKLVQVRGHADSLSIGSELKKRFLSNWELSVVRAATVVRILQEAGLDGKCLSTAGYSFHRPLVSNETTEGRTQNRRIKIVVSSWAK